MKQFFCLITALCCLLTGGFAYPSAYAAEPITEMMIEDMELAMGGATITEDGTILLVSSTDASTNPAAAVAISINPFGETNWKLIDPYDSKENFDYTTVAVLNDGTTYASSSIISRSSDDIITLLNRIENGNVISRTDMQTTVGAKMFEAGDILIVSKSVAPDVELVYYPTLIGYDSQMNVLWEKSYELPFSVRDVLPCAGGFVLIGSGTLVSDTYVVEGDIIEKKLLYQGFIAKIDPQGEILWQQTFPSEFLTFQDGTLLEDGSVVAAGNGTAEDGSTENVLVKVSKDGELLWRKDYPSRRTSFFSVVPDAQGFLVAGMIGGNNMSNSVLLTVMDHEGEILKESTIGDDVTRHQIPFLHTSPYGTYLTVNVRHTRVDQASGEEVWVNKVLIKKIDIE